jgi:hypothetical protein
LTKLPIALFLFQAQRFGAAGDSYVHPVIAVAMLVAVVLIFWLPRKRLLAAFLAPAILIPMDQVIVIAGFHFQMIRILVLAGFVRFLANKAATQRDLLNGGLKAIDKAVLAGTLVAAVDTVLLWGPTAITNQLGTLYTVFGIYFLLRFLIRDVEDVLTGIKALAYTSAFVAMVMAVEQVTHHNPYAYIWASASQSGQTVMIRDGHFRAMACFAHPLLAGTFGGICLPLFVGLWLKEKKSRRTAVVGMIASTIIILAANSSTPLLAYAGGLFAIGLWPVRGWMRTLRWGLIITLTTLHLAMKAPVWALIARIDLTGSSSGYHRYQLIDQCIRRFSDWWMLGTSNNASWGWDMWDLANQYVAVAETSGLLPLIWFLAVIVFGFKYIGRARRAARGIRDERFIWALGAALFSNVVAFFGISYYDQTMVVWYLLLAMIPAACATVAAAEQKETAVAPAIPQLAYASPERPSLGKLITEDSHSFQI